MAKKGKRVIRSKKMKNINIGMVVFAVIFIYLCIVLLQYAVRTKIKMYEVLSGDIANDAYYTGIILRSETVVASDYSGYVNYYLREKEKAAVGNLVFTVDESGSMTEYLNQTSGDESRLSKENLKELKSLLSSYSSSYSNSRFYEVYELNTSLSSMLTEYINISTLQELSSSLNLENNVSFRKCYAKTSGVVIYSIDGMESLTAGQLTADLFSERNYQKVSYRSGEQVASGSPVYKVITDDSWSVMIPLTEEEIVQYKNETRVSVYFPEKNLDVAADFSLVTGADGKTYGKLDFSKYMVQFAGERFVEIEVKQSRAAGLKVPKSALTTADAYKIPSEFLTTGGDSSSEGFYKVVYGNDGAETIEFVEADILRITDDWEKDQALAAGEEISDFCYVSTDNFDAGDYILLPDSNERYQIGATETLTGVYNINRGYAVFKYVYILDENSDYCIVRKNVSYSLKVYDHVVLKAEGVSDGDVLR